MKFSLFLASRFFRKSGEGRKASIPAVKIATAGVAVGLAVMLISVCVVKGFQAEVSGKLTGFASHIEVLDIGSFISPEDHPIHTDSTLVHNVRSTPHVIHVQRISEKIGVLKTHDDFQSIMLKGVAEDYNTSFLASNVVEGELPRFSATKSSNQIVISRMLAERLGLKIGDKVYTYFFENTIKQRRFSITGIYDTHMKQFDEAFVLTDLHTVNRLNSWSNDYSSGLEVHLTSLDKVEETQLILANKLKTVGTGTYNAVSVKENPRTASVLSWLSVLDLNVLVILILMICVAGITMVSGLLILILERIPTIGLLKSLGARNSRIRHTFLWFAAFILARGMFWGNLLGLGIIALQATTGIVSLNPETYYVDAVPVSFPILWILGINVATLLVTMAALVVPSYMVSRVQPAKAIRFE